MNEDLKRLAESATRLEDQARELREEIERLMAAPLAEAVVEVEDPVDYSEARIVAFSMVLDDRPRDEVAQHLAEEFGLTDSAALLDDLYARAAG